MFDVIAAGVGGLVVGFAAGAVVGARRALAPQLSAKRRADVIDAHLRDLRAGGLVDIAGASDEFDDLSLELTDYTKFERGRDVWFQWRSRYRNRDVALEWRDDDETAWLHKHHRAAPLADVGLSADTLSALATDAEHTHDGVPYRLTDHGKTLFFADGSGFGKELSTWELRSQDGKRLIRITRRGEDPHQVSFAERIEPSIVSIYKVR